MRWETVIGLETHVELNTDTKIFCSCSTAFGAPPNTQCCPVCMGLPGSLPVLNRRVVEYAARIALALNCSITPLNRFDRKNYFYPDLPKAYQISQLYLPIARNGSLDVELEQSRRTVRIHEMHMEEDAGKLIHDPDGGDTRIDYNRCGVPLVEIVTEPDFRSADEVVAYLEQLRSVLLYLGISDCRMQEGSLRCDVNLSVRPEGSQTLGVRTEMKNLGSFRAVRRAIEYESQRQIRILESGGRVIRQTLRWDEDADQSIPMRTKEDAADYRYFPEPDLPPVELDEAFLTDLRTQQPELAAQKRARYCKDWGLSAYDARMLTGQRSLAEFFERTVALGAPPKKAANWIMGQVLRQLSRRNMQAQDMTLRPEVLVRLIALVEQGRINRNTAVEVFDAVFDGGDPEEYIAAHGLERISDCAQVRQAVEQVFAENPRSVADWRAGKEKALGFLVGQTMRMLQGKADPQTVNKLIRDRLTEE